MPSTLKADITELIRPHIEESDLKARLETARNMQDEGEPIDKIVRYTGLTEAQLKEHGVIGR